MSRHATAETRTEQFRRTFPALLTLVPLTLLVDPATAAEQRATMTIGATVQGVARIVDPGSPERLVVSAQDIAAGYVEVRPAAALKIDSNSLEGVAIEIRTRRAEFSDVVVNYGGGVARMSGDGLRLVQRGAPDATLPLTYRFLLRPNQTAGDYAWPLEIRATAL